MASRKLQSYAAISFKIKTHSLQMDRHHWSYRATDKPLARISTEILMPMRLDLYIPAAIEKLHASHAFILKAEGNSITLL